MSNPTSQQVLADRLEEWIGPSDSDYRKQLCNINPGDLALLDDVLVALRALPGVAGLTDHVFGAAFQLLNPSARQAFVNDRAVDISWTEICNAIRKAALASGSPAVQEPMLCDTTMTERLPRKCCVGCVTYTDNEGPCRTWAAGQNGRCAYCDHSRGCHAPNVKCPKCGAKPGEPCVSQGINSLGKPTMSHSAR